MGGSGNKSPMANRIIVHGVDITGQLPEPIDMTKFEYPTLVGSKKQVKWATNIRDEASYAVGTKMADNSYVETVHVETVCLLSKLKSS